MYFAIIGDIINSKKLEDRWLVQKHLTQVLDNANKSYPNCIVSKFTITLGDEFQGLLDSAGELLEIIDFIRYEMYPVGIRFGIGIGNMSTEIIQERSIGSDGPAYWAARDAINYIHENNDYGCSKICVELHQEENREQRAESTIQVINSTLRLCDRMESGWTESQHTFVRDMIMNYKYGNDGQYHQKAIAEEVGITPQAINSRIKKTGITTYIEARRSIEQLIQGEWGN